MKHICRHTACSGYAALLSVIIMASLMLFSVVHFSMLSFSVQGREVARIQAMQVRAATASCLNYAALLARQGLLYDGYEKSFAAYGCGIAVYAENDTTHVRCTSVKKYARAEYSAVIAGDGSLVEMSLHTSLPRE